MENRELADQLAGDAGAALTPCHSLEGRGEILHPALQLIRMKPELFAAQGHVAATWRHRDGKRFGPYYRLGYRLGGRQHSIYLGRAGELVEQVRRELEAVQMPLVQRRMFRTLEQQVRASLRIHKQRVSVLLRPYGLRLKGYEVRGWRYSPLRYVIPRRRMLPRAVPRRMLSPMQRYYEPQKRILRFLEARDGLRQAAGAE